jgi:hypothetical protein
MPDWSKYFPGQKRFLNIDELQQAAEEMSEIAEDEKVEAVLIGGAALQYYGSPRLTGDIDFSARDSLSLEDQGKLSFGGEKLKAPNGVPVDWIVRDDDYADLYNAAISDPEPDAPIPIARPEYLLVMKMSADRATDRADVEWLITNDVVDLKRARAIIKKYLGIYATEDFDSIVSEIEWKKSRKGK